MSAARAPQQGFTYVGLLIVVVIMGLMLTVAARIWATTEQRERETQLLWAGHAYRMAIASYYASGHQYPATLQNLLLDDRSPVPVRHLRSLYPDPMTGAADWTLIQTPSGTGVMGVASSSQGVPIKRKNFDLADSTFTDTACYCLWQFVYYPSRFNRLLPKASSSGLQPGSPGPLQSPPNPQPDPQQPGPASDPTPPAASTP
ncbi:MAG: type II secretion system protein [Gammaproteobacteria bacterium]|nr:type II secretion system protein [Gammaproteobacteria bacterium]MBV9697499.1 type II secretion system protein [Gammaproteobacteria bacterium]